MANSALADQSAAIQETHPAVRRAALSRAAIYLVLIVGAAAAIRSRRAFTARTARMPSSPRR